MLRHTSRLLRNNITKQPGHTSLNTRRNIMASARTIQLQLGEWPEYHRQSITQDSAKTASELLQKNHDSHHVFFNADGFHNHIVHHLLTIWALGASPSALEKGYSTNSSYQRPAQAPRADIVKELYDTDKFMSYLGPEKYHGDFLEFFTQEIEKKGWESVLNEYVFAGDKRADDMLVRLFSGFLHPIIHLGFGIEFHQPAIIAEGLAQAACHDNWHAQLFLPAETAAKQNGNDKSIVALLDEIQADKQIRDAVKFSDPNKVRDGLLARCPERILELVSQVRVKPDQLEEKTAEMQNTSIYYTGGAQRADKMVKFDFFLMHCVNASIFSSAFLKQNWLSTANKVRMLEWKIRLDLVLYASRKSPEIRLDDIRSYKPKQPSGWDEIEDRVCRFGDDGHASKLVRAIAHAQQTCKPYESKDEFRLKGDDWLQLGHMAIDSVEGPGENWVRSTGFDEAWENVPGRARL